MRRRGGDFCVAPRSRKGEMSKRGKVIAVDQIVSHARMPRLNGENAVQYFRSLFLVRVSFVAGSHSFGDQSEGVKGSGFVVCWVTAMKSSHRFTEGKCASAVIETF